MKPNFFLAGTTKGGTSTIFLWLRRHPEVFLPERKELHYFCRCPEHLRAAPDENAYLGFFDNVTSPVAGEASPCYLYYPDTPEKILSTVGESRILISLRDPIERFWSHFLMNSRYRPNQPSATEIVDAWPDPVGRRIATEDLIGVGLYGKQVQRYLDAFGIANVKIMFLEELGLHPGDAMADIFAFLNLPQHHVNTDVRDKTYVVGKNRVSEVILTNPGLRRLGVKLIPARGRRFLKYRVLGRMEKPELPLSLRQRLEDIYRSDCFDLEQVVKRPLPWTWHRQ